MKKYLDILGHKVSDKATGFNGVAVSVSFDLYGCIQVVVNPGLGSDGKPMESHWFDFNRLQITDNNPVMLRPNYEKTMTENGMINAQHGCSENHCLGSNFMSQYAGLSFYQKIVLMNKKTKIMPMLLLAIPYFIFYLLYLLFDFISFRLHKILIWFNNVIQR